MFSNICIWKIIDFYSIQHLTIAKGISFFFFYISDLIRHKVDYQFEQNLYIFYFTDILGYILLFIGTLIHNEIIILNCCNLNAYTYKKLKEREEIDLKAIEDSFSTSYDQAQQSAETLTSMGTIKSNDTQNIAYTNTILDESIEF